MVKSAQIALLIVVVALVHPITQACAQPGMIALDFENADIETVIRAVSEVAGFGYVLAPDVRGKVTLRTAGPIRREDVLPLFLSVLEVHGFTAVKAGDIYTIARMDRRRAIAREEVHVIRLQYADAHHVAAILNAVFLGSPAPAPLIVPDARTNSLVIRGRASDIGAVERAVRGER